MQRGCAGESDGCRTSIGQKHGRAESKAWREYAESCEDSGSYAAETAETMRAGANGLGDEIIQQVKLSVKKVAIQKTQERKRKKIEGRGRGARNEIN